MVVLATLEVIVPGYFFLGFAIGALVMGVILLADVVALSLPVVLVIFAVLSLVAYLALRKIFGLRNGQVKIWDRDINDN